ncbi:H-NS histone family protein [Paraburkholderia sp. Se-20369]|nr:H-NS histone family protein [Paraburkholderia sp. Se-20369]TCW83961.1 DNA-binding protein [Burkholderia sp. SRS-46]
MSNDSLQELLARRAELDAQITTQRTARSKDVVEQIVKLIRDYEIDWRVIEARLLNVGVAWTQRPRHVEPRYWDPETGATWTGRGRRPQWLKGRNPEDFRIKSFSETAGESTPTEE